MVKRTQNTKSAVSNKKANEKENLELFLLVRDVVTGAHHVVQRSQVTTSKKLHKLEPGDEITVGQRSSRVRGMILMIGVTHCVL